MLCQALDRVWAAIPSGQAISARRPAAGGALPAAGPTLDDPFGTDLAAPAQNAVIAVLQTVECARDGDPQRAEGVGDLSLDAFEAYVDLTEGQGPIYDAEFVESHAIVRRERDDQDQDLVALGRVDQRGPGIQQRRDFIVVVPGANAAVPVVVA